MAQRNEIETGQVKGHASIRNFNERRILTLIRQEQALPKAAIAKQTGLSAQSATIIINKLEEAGLVSRGKPQRGRVGQPVVPFGLKPEGAYGVGLKIGRRSFDLTLVDFAGVVQATLNERFAYPTVDALLMFLERGLPALTVSLSDEQQRRIAGLGIATPFEIWNWVEEAGADQSELEKWQAFDFQQRVGAIVKMPVYICNDDTAACSAELTFGNPERLSDFMYFFVGTFVGGGVVINNQLFTGFNNNAGAFGSLPLRNEQGRSEQLLQLASLYLLEGSLDAGQTTALHSLTTDWSEYKEVLTPWLEKAADGIAKAIVTTQSVLDLQRALIDGAMPDPVKQQLVKRINQKLEQYDWRGLHVISADPGVIGPKAQSIGSANLPLMANFYLENLQI